MTKRDVEASIDLEACEPGPAMNETLKKIYSIVPSIGAWAKSGRPSPIWGTDLEAGRAILEYVGPAISPLIADSFHYTKEDVEFLGRPEVVNAALAIVKDIYSGHCRLVNGFFPDPEPEAHAQP